jgi:hypothetical protein
MLTPVARFLAKRQYEGDVTAPISNDQNVPVTIFDQKRQLRQNAPTARSQFRWTFEWL